MPQHTHAQSQPSTTPSTKDPVCGMDVAPETAAGHAEHAGQTYHFCSRNWLAKFEADPVKYLGAPKYPPSASGTSGEYTCPMHPEVRQPGPGTCPKCGMALKPATIAPVVTRTEYTCPPGCIRLHLQRQSCKISIWKSHERSDTI